MLSLKTYACLILINTALALSAYGQPVYYCNRTLTDVKIDGNLNESEWESALWSEAFGDITGNPLLKPLQMTRVKMLWNDTYLYIAACLHEKHISASLKQRDTVIFYDNDFEVFIDPDGDTHHYFEFEVNAYGTYWDLLLSRPYRDGGKAYTEYNADGLLLAVNCLGSINDPSDEDSCWIIEMAIPMNNMLALTQHRQLPVEGDHWRINFSRVDWDYEISDGNYHRKLNSQTGLPVPENNRSWSPQEEVNMHMPEKWGYLVFCDSRPCQTALFNDPDAPARNYLRNLYYFQKKYYGIYKKYCASPDTADAIKTYRQLGLTAPLIVLKDNDYIITTLALGSNKQWHISADGKIWHSFVYKNWMWMHAGVGKSKSQWTKYFRQAKKAGIDGILSGSAGEELEMIIPLAEKQGLEIHAWMWMLNCNDSNMMINHHDCYNVNRLGESSCDHPQYVPYYKWLCPNNPMTLEYLKLRVWETAQTPGLSGIHLDYIRYPDVMLPEALQPHYKIVQDKEYPQYDYCYCSWCRKKFLSEYHIDIDTLKDPEKCIQWKEFRYQSIAGIVSQLDSVLLHKLLMYRDLAPGDRIVEPKLLLSAAVFPGPQIARSLVRQDWPRWQVDALMPMLYQNFYNEDIEWIGEEIVEGRKEIKERIPLYAGLYIPELSPDEMVEAIQTAFINGASGIALFDFNAMTRKHWKYLKIILAHVKKNN